MHASLELTDSLTEEILLCGIPSLVHVQERCKCEQGVYLLVLFQCARNKGLRNFEI